MVINEEVFNDLELQSNRHMGLASSKLNVIKTRKIVMLNEDCQNRKCEIFLRSELDVNDLF